MVAQVVVGAALLGTDEVLGTSSDRGGRNTGVSFPTMS